MRRKIKQKRIKKEDLRNTLNKKGDDKMIIDRIALSLVIIGALNWLLVGLFQYDLVSGIFGGPNAVVARVIYTLVGIAGLWCISLLFRRRCD